MVVVLLLVLSWLNAEKAETGILGLVFVGPGTPLPCGRGPCLLSQQVSWVLCSILDPRPRWFCCFCFFRPVSASVSFSSVSESCAAIKTFISCNLIKARRRRPALTQRQPVFSSDDKRTAGLSGSTPTDQSQGSARFLLDSHSV